MRSWVAFSGVAVALAAASPAGASPTKRVFAYASGTTEPARWDLVTDVAWFAETMGTDGTLATTGWSSSGKALVTAAHTHGARAHLTVMLFNTTTNDKIHTFLSTSAAVDAGTQAIVDAVKANDGDGVNLDFEFVNTADKAAFVGFVQGLAAALHAAVPGAEVSIATPSEAYPGYDYAALGAAADVLMIMGYDYHWATSDPGPVAPLASSPMWGSTLSQAYTIGLFKAKVPAAKLLMGMPLYGYDYHATSATIPGSRVAGSTASAVEYKNAEVLAPKYGRQWDDASASPYYVYQDPDAGPDAGWRQTFYEDTESLGLKVDQAVSSGLSGIGLWALGYESPSFWAMLETKLSVDGGAPDAGIGLVADAAPGFDGGGEPDVSTSDAAAAQSDGCTMALDARHHPGAAGALGLATTILAVRRRNRRRRQKRD